MYSCIKISTLNINMLYRLETLKLGVIKNISCVFRTRKTQMVFLCLYHLIFLHETPSSSATPGLFCTRNARRDQTMRTA